MPGLPCGQRLLPRWASALLRWQQGAACEALGALGRAMQPCSAAACNNKNLSRSLRPQLGRVETLPLPPLMPLLLLQAEVVARYNATRAKSEKTKADHARFLASLSLGELACGLVLHLVDPSVFAPAQGGAA